MKTPKPKLKLARIKQRSGGKLKRMYPTTLFLPKSLTKKNLSISGLKQARFSKANLAIFILIFGSIGAYALFQSNAAGPNVWVSTTGNDSTCVRNDQTKPCLTAAKAWSIAQAGDTISVADGTYTNTGLAGSECKFTTGKASDTTFVGSTNAIMPCFWNLDTNGVAYHMVVDGLALSLSNIAGNNVTIKNGIFACQDAAPYTLYSPDNKCSARLSFTGAAQNVTIMNETIGPNYESGACGGNAPNGSDFFGVTGPVLLKNVTFHDNRRGCGSSGVQHQELLRMEDGNSNVTFDGVVLYNGPNSGWWNGSSFDGQGSNSAELFITGTQTNFLMQNSYTYGTGNVSIDGASDSNFQGSSQLRNNVFTNGTLFQHAYPSSFLITDNVYPSCPINAGSGSSGGTVRKNLLFGGGSATGSCSADISTAQGLSGIFTDPNNGVFSLKTGSPAIDAGSSVNGDYAPLDKAGIIRPQGTAPDAGPFEYVPTVANLWVDTNGGTCSRQATAGTYSDTQACGSMSAAFGAASAGDTIILKCGSYGAQSLSGSAKASAVSFYGETYTQPTTASGVVAATSCSTVASLNIATDKIHVIGIQATGASTVLSSAVDELDIGSGTFTDVVIDGWHGHQSFVGASGVTVQFSAFGNANFCGTGYNNDEDAFRFWSYGSNVKPDNDKLIHSVIHDWIGPPDGQCGAGNGHNDMFQTPGGDNMVFDGNLFYNGPTSNMQAGEFSGGVIGSFIIQNNYFGPTEGSNNLSIGQGHCAGIVIQNNIVAYPPSGIPTNNNGCIGTMTQNNNIYLGSIFSCAGTGGTFSGDHNIFQVSGGTTCGTNAKRCAPSWLNGAPPSNGAAWTPELNTSDTCTKDYSASTFPTTDFFNTARPNGATADAGPYELVSGGGGSSVPGDLNNDSHVNVFDLSILLSHYGTSASASQGDINSDGTVNIFDLSILLSHYGT